VLQIRTCHLNGALACVLLPQNIQQSMTGATYVCSVLRFTTARITVLQIWQCYRKKCELPLDPATARLNHSIDSLEQVVAKPLNVKIRVDIFDDALQALLVLRGSFQPALAWGCCRQPMPDPADGGFMQ
jgi:hypothetical protein